MIEETAQAIGAEYREHRAGSIGHIGCFSLFPSKNLGGTGDGEMITTNADALSQNMTRLRNHGMRPKYYHQLIGRNFRLATIQAAVLRMKLPHLDGWSGQRQLNATCYRDLFARAELDQVVLPTHAANRTHIYNQFAIRCPRRDELMAHLKTNSLGVELYYPVSLHEQECFAYLGYRHGDFPHSKQAIGETLALPLYPELPPEQQASDVDTIATCYARG